MNAQAATTVLALVVVLVSCTETQDILQVVQVGQSKQEIRQALGEPYEIKIIKKRAGPIWGPEEDFWDKIRDSTRLEVWRYKSEAGQLNLYFVAGDDHVTYRAFAPRGVVYESRPLSENGNRGQ
jgi:hypothetical protein